MKNLSRLTALLLALLMLCATGVAESAIPLEDLTSENYASMLADAQEAESQADVVLGIGIVNADGVKLHKHLFLDWGAVSVPKGTEVTVYEGKYDGFLTEEFKAVFYKVSYNGETGYINVDYIDIKPEIAFTPWDGASETVTLACTADGAASYEWQRGVAGEDGEIAWEAVEGATSAGLTLAATPENLRYAYRCVAKDESGAEIAASEGVMLISPELAQWISSSGTEVSGEMLALAAQASSLDSMMLVGDRLIHVRTGEAFASYDEATGVLTHIELNVPFGKVENGAILPLEQDSRQAEEEME